MLLKLNQVKHLLYFGEVTSHLLCVCVCVRVYVHTYFTYMNRAKEVASICKNIGLRLPESNLFDNFSGRKICMLSVMSSVNIFTCEDKSRLATQSEQGQSHFLIRSQKRVSKSKNKFTQNTVVLPYDFTAFSNSIMTNGEII